MFTFFKNKIKKKKIDNILKLADELVKNIDFLFSKSYISFLFNGTSYMEIDNAEGDFSNYNIHLILSYYYLNCNLSNQNTINIRVNLFNISSLSKFLHDFKCFKFSPKFYDIDTDDIIVHIIKDITNLEFLLSKLEKDGLKYLGYISNQTFVDKDELKIYKN